jgi:DNA polymerase
MPTLIVDFETRSTINLKKCGATRYAADPSTDVLCLGYKLDDGEAKLWFRGDSVPEEFSAAAREPDHRVVAFNAGFERAHYDRILVPRYGFPALPLAKWACIQAASLAHALPASLEGVGAALSLPQQKDVAAGRKILKRVSGPRKPHKGEDPDRTYWNESPEDLAELGEYCRHDVDAEHAIFCKIGFLSDAEQKIWLLDQIINDRGIYIDRTLAAAANAIAGQVKPDLNEDLHELTDGAIETVHQGARLQEWLGENGCAVTGVDKTTLRKALTRKALSEPARRAIELRLAGAPTSASKLGAMLNWVHEDGRVRGCFKYHGAKTGRWASWGIQLQNLKKPNGADIDALIKLVLTGDIVQVPAAGLEPMNVVGDLTRAMICAAPGHRFLIGDFSGIESRVLAWLAGQTDKLELWKAFDRTGSLKDDVYYRLGTKFGFPPEIARDQGKICDLAFGYKGGEGAWRAMSPDDGLTKEEIKARQQAWQSAHPYIVQLGKAMDRSAIHAVHNRFKAVKLPRQAWQWGSFESDGIFLRMTLPSGRQLAYPFPELKTGKFEKPVVSFKESSLGKWEDCRHGQGAYSGIWLENVTQAVARDILAEAMLQLEAAGYKVVLHVHDEIVCEMPDGVGSVEEFKAILETPPAWASTLPLSSKVRNGPRFSKSSSKPAEAHSTHEPAPQPTREPDQIDEESESEADHGNGYAKNSFEEYSAGEERKGHQTAAYIYGNEHGEPWLRVARTSGHTFPTAHWKNGKWVKGWPPRGEPVYPFRLRECLAAPSDQPVVPCEGEKDTLSAVALGFDCATCNHGGAGKWYAEHAEWFKGRRQAIIPEDNDAAGRAHAIKVAATLQAVGVLDIRIVRFPELAEHGDLSDWVALGHTREEFLARANAAPKWTTALRSARASTFTLRAVEWIWPGRFAVGKLGIIAGLPDEGKGQIFCDIAARITRPGSAWPCNEGIAPFGNVILLTAEDDIADTVHPRLKAAGADPDRVEIVQMVREGDNERMFSLITDLAILRQKICEVGDVRLVQIDPISAYLGVKKMDSFRNTDVRAVLSPLVTLAAELRVGIIGIMHFNKKTDVTNALLRISDSLAFGATARHVYAAVNDAENKRKLFVKGKNNLAPFEQKALAYNFSVREVGADEKTGEPIFAPYIVWHPEYVDVTATEAMQAAADSKAPAARDSAKNFLKEMLADGPVASDEIEEAAAANGIAERTLYRAKAELRIRAVKDGPMKDGQRTWRWHPPAKG